MSTRALNTRIIIIVIVFAILLIATLYSVWRANDEDPISDLEPTPTVTETATAGYVSIPTVLADMVTSTPEPQKKQVIYDPEYPSSIKTDQDAEEYAVGAMIASGELEASAPIPLGGAALVPPAAPPQADLPMSQRHPDAGAYVVYRGQHTANDLNQPYFKGGMAYVRLYQTHTGAGQYSWTALNNELDEIIEDANKKAIVTITVGYCPNLPWPAWYQDRVAFSIDQNASGQGCPIPQYWDPVYWTDIYKPYITALANELARYDANDSNPTQTDIVLVRAAINARTMENMVAPSQFGNMTPSDFTPATNGRIYNVTLSNALNEAYLDTVLNWYKDELLRAYNAESLPYPPLAAGKPDSDFWSEGPNTAGLATNGLTFERLSSDPNPNGWYWDMWGYCQPGTTRCSDESGNNFIADRLGSGNYWETLSALSAGVEVKGFYGRNRRDPSIQPLGAASWIHNRENMQFVNKYAGYMREPGASPGAWCALRGAFSEQYWNSTPQHSLIWRDFCFLIEHMNAEDSVYLFGRPHTANGNGDGVRYVPVFKYSSASPNWSLIQTQCEATYGADECRHFQQKPDLYIGTNAQGQHEHTFNASDLGTMQWCDGDIHCTNGGTVNRTEPMLYARRTDSASGNDYMRFDINDTFANSLTGNQACFTIRYLDKGTDQFRLVYDSTGSNEKTLTTVTKTDTNIWDEITSCASDAELDNGGTNGADFSLYNMGDGDDIFHMVEVERSGALPTPTPTTAATATPTTGPTPTSAANNINLPIVDFEDDAREFTTDPLGTPDGIMDLYANSLRIPGDTNLAIIHGLRFQNVAIPKNSIITTATIDFVAASNRSAVTNWMIKAESSDNAPAITNANADLSSRTAGGQLVRWDGIGTWTAGTTYTTPNLKNIVQEVVNDLTWSSGNAILFLIDGDAGLRESWSKDGDVNNAPILNIQWTAAPGPGTPTATLPPLTTPTPTNTPTVVATPVDTNTPTPIPPTATATPGTVQQDTYRPEAFDDDADELLSNGSVQQSTVSHRVIDTRLVFIRVDGVAMPAGHEVVAAHLEFKAESTNSGASDWLFHAHDHDDAPPVDNSTNGITNLVKTSASGTTAGIANWTAGNTYTVTVPIAPIQEVLDRPGWSSGNALVLLIAGQTNNSRHFKSHEGSPVGDRPTLYLSHQIAAPATHTPTVTPTPTRTATPNVVVNTPTSIPPPQADCLDSGAITIANNSEWIDATINSASYHTFCLQPGTYSGVDLTRDGTAQQVRTIRPAVVGTIPHAWDVLPANRVVFDSNFDVEGAYWVIDGVELQGDGTSTDINFLDVNSGGDNFLITRSYLHSQKDLIVAKDDADDVSISNNVLENTNVVINDEDTVCIRFQAADRITITNNEIYNCSDGIQPPGGSPFPSGVHIENNNIYITSALYVNCSTGASDVSGDCAAAENAIDIKRAIADAGNPSVIRGNVLHGFRETKPDGTNGGGTGSRGAAIVLQDDVDDMLIENNTIFDSAMGLMFADSNPQDVTIRRNFFHDVGNYTASIAPQHTGEDPRVVQMASTNDDVLFYNNTIAYPHDATVNYFELSDDPTDLNIRNNLFIDANDYDFSGSPDSDQWMCSNGFLGNSVEHTFGTFCSASTNITGTIAFGKMVEQHCVTLYPITNPTQHCFTGVIPASDSPLVDAGEVIDPLTGAAGVALETTDARGAAIQGAFDIGAFEASFLLPTPTWTPTPVPTNTPVPAPTFTPVPTWTPTATPTNTNTPLPPPTWTHTPTPTPTHTATPGNTPTPTPTSLLANVIGQNTTGVSLQSTCVITGTGCSLTQNNLNRVFGDNSTVRIRALVEDPTVSFVDCTNCEIQILVQHENTLDSVDVSATWITDTVGLAEFDYVWDRVGEYRGQITLTDENGTIYTLPNGPPFEVNIFEVIE